MRSIGPARIKLFGAVTLLDVRGAEVPLSSRRARALLAYLRLSPAGARTREHLAGMLWSDRPEAQARASLRQCVLELRKALERAGVPALEARRDMITLSLAQIESDLDTLEAALSRDDVGAAVAALRDAGSGQLLEDAGFDDAYDGWCAETRVRLERRVGAAVAQCLVRLETGRRWAHVRELAEAYLLRDPLDETVVAAAMRADIVLGSPTGARRRFDRLEAMLLKAYGVGPGTAPREALAAESLPLATIASSPKASARGNSQRPTVIVGAFDAAGPDHELREVARFLREEIVSGLTRFREVDVSSDPRRTSAMTQERVPMDASEYVLRATLRPTATGVTLTTQLLRASDGHAMWSDRIALQEAGVDAAIDSISDRVVAAVLPMIDADMRGHDAGGLYHRYIQARSASTRARTFEDARAAADELQALIDEHPSFVLPYAPLGRLFNTDFQYTRAESSGEREYDRALALAKAALSIDRGHVHAYTLSGWCYLRRRRWDLAHHHFEQVVTLNPFHARRVMEAAFGFLFLGDAERARSLLDRCVTIHPLPQDEFFTDLGLVELVEENHDRAASYFELVARPSLWASTYAGINDALAGRLSRAKAQASFAAIAAIWHPEAPADLERIVAWLARHHPFRVTEVGARFAEGARRMLSLARAG